MKKTRITIARDVRAYITYEIKGELPDIIRDMLPYCDNEDERDANAALSLWLYDNAAEVATEYDDCLDEPYPVVVSHEEVAP